MIAFLVVTSLINISLGYALAVYVSRARMQAADAALGSLHEEMAIELRAEQAIQQAMTSSAGNVEAPAASGEDRRTDDRNATWVASDDAPSLLEATMAAESAAPPAAAADAPSAMASEATMVEKDLLAGIEEFRLQLAKIKGHAEGEPLAAALGVSHAGK